MSWLDTRDLIRRIADEYGITDGGDDEHVADVLSSLDDEDREDAEAILRLLDEVRLPEAEVGVILIPEDDFADYARQFAEDIGAVEDASRWPANHLDWARAADELRADFSAVEHQGTTYFYRA